MMIHTTMIHNLVTVNSEVTNHKSSIIWFLLMAEKAWLGALLSFRNTQLIAHGLVLQLRGVPRAGVWLGPRACDQDVRNFDVLHVGAVVPGACFAHDI